MRTITLLATSLLLAGPAAAQDVSASRPTGRAVAITFDDLPAVSTRTGLDVWSMITDSLLTVLQRHRAPAIGFVNEIKLDVDGRVDADRVALLRRWLHAGQDLGNHTYSHRSLHTIPLVDYQRDILRGEEVLRPLLAEHRRTPQWFRHPQLHAGRALDVKRGLDAFLRRHGYRIAPVTIDNQDWIFARAYDNALDRGDAALVQRVEHAYLAYMDTVFGFYEKQAVAIVGYELPQILLLHANRLNAMCLERLFAMMQRRGYRYITLEQAMRDPAYARGDIYTGPAGITWLHRWALTDGRDRSIFAGEPDVPAFISEVSGISDPVPLPGSILD
jgi:peptidoglycan/xylan/chitin deacetylase (PgdA/CDA1 family)